MEQGVLPANLVSTTVGIAPALVLARQPPGPAGLGQDVKDVLPRHVEVIQVVVDLEELGLDEVDVIE